MDEYNQKLNEYKDYIDNHIMNVRKVFDFYGEELCDKLHLDINRLADMVNDHDKSKYSIEEFEGYRCHFYPTEEETADPETRAFNKKKYDAAWLHHLRNNAHHPEFWVYKDDEGNPRCHPMDPIHVAEMLLDWAAVGIDKGDTAYEYWINNINEKPLHSDTIKLVDSCIGIFKHSI